MMNFLKKIVSREDNSGSYIDEKNVVNPEECPGLIYVNCLLLHMARMKINRLELKPDDYPKFRYNDTFLSKENTPYESIANRIKVVLDLNPQKYTSARTGKVCTKIDPGGGLSDYCFRVDVFPNDERIVIIMETEPIT